MAALVDTYMADNPGVSIEVRTGDYNPLHQQLQSQLVSGSGAPTIAAIGEDYIAQFVAQPDAFVDLKTLGAGQDADAYLPWAWKRGSNGDALIGLPANVSGLALCYRADLLEAAGLPSDRTELADLMGDSWEGFIATGKRYVAATGKPFLDSATTVLRPVRQQDAASYVNGDGEATAQGAAHAFDVALQSSDAGFSAGLTPFTSDWDAGLTTDAFAVSVCPMWGAGDIQAVVGSGDTSARWDVMDIPGPGGSWGGMYYAIAASADSAQRRAAWEFLSWLSQPDQQLALFRATGNLPAQPGLYDDAAITSYSNAFFSGAPLGQLMSKAAAELATQDTYSVKDSGIEATLQDVLDRVQAGSVARADAWKVATDAVALTP